MNEYAKYGLPGLKNRDAKLLAENDALAKVVCLGLDIGSTTVKAIGLDPDGKIIFNNYIRHNSHVRSCLSGLLEELAPLCHSSGVSACITGSGGIDIAIELALPFIQEVLACTLAIGQRVPDADVVIELGGEDAKLTYLTGGVEQRMNETCAGGTGAFIDQMAAFIGTDAAGLDKLACNFKTLYPLASRCGVFAKSDILPLLNEGCKKEDLAASIMQAVVSQTISGLAQGRPIAGKVVFLGGPLHFLSSLQQRFTASLKNMREAVFPENGHFFVALGAALHGRDLAPQDFNPLLAVARLKQPARTAKSQRLPPLFATKADFEAFKTRHAKKQLDTLPLKKATGSAWLGFDCGSTTLKAVLLDEQNRLLYSWYAPNRGDPLKAALQALAEIYAGKNDNLQIAGTCATGYGSALLTAALHLDLDEVETVAHFTAAAFFDPQVSFILDIGGQDIKYLRIRDGVIDRISLNEACSSGCGSFIENFSSSLKMELNEFVEAALWAANPVDLGTRCTVFMNSKVKQAQKEGAKIGDIAAGLSYSVVRNAIFKVMKIGSPGELGSNIVAQGGAFLNDALLRALELELNINVTRPPVSGLMGAFGAALIAKKRLAANGPSSILTAADLPNFKMQTKTARCKHCANNCLLTVSSFGKGEKFISGNRCERALETRKKDLPNLLAWKYQRLFSYQPLPPNKASRGVIGIPRCLNIYENYPLWFRLLTDLGFRVELSQPSSHEAYYQAFDTIPSQTVCYPAKLVHGHVLELARRGIKNIFYPCVQHEQTDADFRHGTYNCPVVISYPELIKLNMAELTAKNVNFIHDFLPLDRDRLPGRLAEIPLFAKIPKVEIEKAVKAAFAEIASYRKELREQGEAALRLLRERGEPGIVLAGHPYHADPEVNHGIPELINSCGLGVITEDAIAHLQPDPGQLRVVDQWAYHSRLYRAGAYAADCDNLAVLQLVSFGCGLDAITADQLEEIVMRNGSLYAQIKIDEGGNLGPARIRIRSLLAAMREKQQTRSALIQSRRNGCARADANRQTETFPPFLPEMRHTHTLLVPQMSPLHFQFVPQIFGSEGYNAILLPHVTRQAIELGLRHVNNDACYPAIVIIGQLLAAVRSGQYDINKIALVVSQTGGGCRATNYLGFLRKALTSAGLGQIPIANFSSAIHAPGIKLTPRFLARMIMAGHYGDAMMRTLHRLRPYEKEKGATEALVAKWSKKAAANIASGSIMRFQRNMFAMIREFDRLPITNEPRRPQIGLVGEILLKYHPDANNHAAQIIEEEGGEAVVTDIMDFMLYGMYDHVFNYEHLAGSRSKSLLGRLGIAWQEISRFSLRLALAKSRRFTRPARFQDLRSMATKLISLGHQTGEGWLLGAEMIRMLESGVSGILCMQPFGCLPNHVVGKGLIRELKQRYPQAVIMPLDYDPGASEVNQINRIKLMMRSGMRQLGG